MEAVAGGPGGGGEGWAKRSRAGAGDEGGAKRGRQGENESHGHAHRFGREDGGEACHSDQPAVQRDTKRGRQGEGDGEVTGTYNGASFDQPAAAARDGVGEWQTPEAPLPVDERLRSKHVIDSDYNRARGVRLREMREQGVLVDGTVRVARRSYAVHRAVLVAASPVFDAIFTSGLAESLQNAVTLEDVGTESFEVCLDFMYTGQVLLTAGNAECVLRCADRLGLSSLRRACIDWLLSVLSVDNCVRLWRLADQLAIPELVDECFAKAVDNFEVVARGEDFAADASCKLLSLLLQAQDLPVAAEEDVVAQVFRYVDHDPATRLESLPALLESARLALLQREGLENVMLRIEGLRGEAVGRLRRLVAALMATEDSSDVGSGAAGARAIPAHWGEARDGARAWLFAVGGMSDDDHLANVLRFDARRSDWTHLSPMPSGARYALGTVCLQGRTFVGGGCRPPVWNLGTLESLDVQEGRWEQHSDMTWGRSDFGMSAVGDTIYVAGGSTTRVVEAFAADRGEWTTIVSLPNIIGSCRMCDMDGCLYVAGGYTDSDRILDTVLRCDPREGAWSQLAPMSAPRLAAALCAGSGCLYAVGGFNHESLHLNSVEVYDIRADRWRAVASMAVPRYDLGVSILLGKIYAVGGCDVDDNSTRVVEEYNISRDEWKLSAPLPVPTQYLGLCAWA